MTTSQSANDTNRKALTQWCMASQLFTDQALTDAIARIYGDDDAEAAVEIDAQAEVEQINSSLRVLSLQLRRAMHQHSGGRVWALVNTNADKIATGATPYTPAELAMLKALVEAIFTSADGNYAVDLHTALRTISSSSGAPGSTATFARRDAQDLVARLCEDGWVDRTDTGFVVLGARALIELQSFFADGFGDYVRHCSLCKEMATCGRVCLRCDDPVHPFCADQISASVGSLSCPNCHQPMTDAPAFGPGETGVPHNIVAATPRSVGTAELSPEPL
ncbi:hypothetical protein EV175_004820 [Coemansia sp. RSA 1933]|nr:hypothetical protein EV175_004820 [Coemansia sp. RSA 1933]